jgi:predicted transcriptional regulator
MATTAKIVRQSISLPSHVARHVRGLAKTNNKSANSIIVELIESGIEAQEQERQRFFELTDRLARSIDVAEHKHLKAELARMTFGE